MLKAYYIFDYVLRLLFYCFICIKPHPNMREKIEDLFSCSAFSSIFFFSAFSRLSAAMPLVLLQHSPRAAQTCPLIWRRRPFCGSRRAAGGGPKTAGGRAAPSWPADCGFLVRGDALAPAAAFAARRRRLPLDSAATMFFALSTRSGQAENGRRLCGPLLARGSSFPGPWRCPGTCCSSRSAPGSSAACDHPTRTYLYIHFF